MSKPDLSKLKIDRSASSASNDASSKSKTPATLSIVALAVLLLVFWFLRSPAEIKPAVDSSNSATINIANQGSAPSGSTLLNATGYVVAQRKAAVSSKATGRLKDLRVVEGDTVKEGSIIGVLENEDMEAVLKEREANLGLLRARISWAQAELEDATTHKVRLESARKSNAVSQTDYDQALARFKKASSDLASSQASIVVAEAQVQRAKVDLEYTFIVAPFDGTVLTKNADVGEIVAPFGSSSNSRAAVVTIADMSSLEVEADVSEANITKVFVGQECDITLDSFPGKTYHGVVSKIVPTVDRAKATVLTKIKFVDRDEHVIPEMSAKVAFRPR